MAQEFGDFPLKCPTCLDEYYDRISVIEPAGKSVCPACKTNILLPPRFDELLNNLDGALDEYCLGFARLTPNPLLIK